MVQVFKEQEFHLQPGRWTGAGEEVRSLSSRGCQMIDFGQLWVWRDPALSRSLGWYAAVAANSKPAKFRIAATIPVSLGLEDSSELALWEELDRLTPVFLSRWSEVRGGRADLSPPAEDGSLLDLCPDLATRNGADELCSFSTRELRRMAPTSRRPIFARCASPG